VKKQNCFINDYNQIAHPVIAKAITGSLNQYYPGYGVDSRTENAKDIIGKSIGSEHADIHLMVGGTQTNLIAISAFLRPYEAVIAASTAHINVHETGAIEATGHKILSFNTDDGKLTARDVRAAMEAHEDEHMAKPKLVFISQASELGTVYRKSELVELRNACDEFDLLLYIDGARLGYALTSEHCDLDLPDIARFADAFYIGGTKNGLLFGEALVIVNPTLKKDFRYSMKQRGGLLAKGFLLGIQFEALFENNLYFELAAHANEMAARLTNEIGALGYDFLIETQTNQVFPIVSKAVAEQLETQFSFEKWRQIGENELAIRFITTWSTDSDDIASLLDQLKLHASVSSL
jgi:threonine aldolase